MSSRTKAKIAKRAFLNQEKSLFAFSGIEMCVDSWKENEEEMCQIIGSIVIADCSRQIALELSCYNREDTTKIKQKIKKLSNMLNQASKFIDDHEHLLLTRKQHAARDKRRTNS